jgi:hypothetical protein
VKNSTFIKYKFIFKIKINYNFLFGTGFYNLGRLLSTIGSISSLLILPTIPPIIDKGKYIKTHKITTKNTEVNGIAAVD